MSFLGILCCQQESILRDFEFERYFPLITSKTAPWHVVAATKGVSFDGPFQNFCWLNLRFCRFDPFFVGDG